MTRLLAAPDKFRGTASAREIAAAMAAPARAAGWDVDLAPVSDGGEGLLDCFGGANRSTVVAGPLGKAVEARWRQDGDRAVLEMAAASGWVFAGERNDPMAADTRGTGELIAAAIGSGACHILVGAGGSASTDGGLGAVEVLRSHCPLDGSRGVTVVVATDVRTLFVDSAAVFAPQKGADPDQVVELTARLDALADRYCQEFGVDVRTRPGGGAAGGLAGGLAALGAAIRPGFDVVAEQLELARRISAADLVLTGEGRFDETSRLGKATGSLVDLCGRLDVPVAVIAGQIAEGMTVPAGSVDLTRRFGADRARRDTLRCVTDAARDTIAPYA